MKLLDLLVKELPKMGGWPEGARETIEMHMDGDIFFDGDCAPDEFTLPQCSNGWAPGMGCFSNEVTREQYEAALAASEEWIEWGGGRCPVDDGVMIDVRYRDMKEKTLPANELMNGRDATSAFWRHDNQVNDIIAYRLHRDINSRAKDDRLEQDLNECIGQGVDMPEWNGDGLPPVGCECEAKQKEQINWTRLKVIAVENGSVFGFWDGVTSTALNSNRWEFRPLRTEVQKAMESAKHIIAELCRDSASNGHSADLIMEAIAAGKIPGVKLEVK